MLETGWSVPPLPAKPEAGKPLPAPPGARRSGPPRPPPPGPRATPPPPNAFEDVTRVDPDAPSGPEELAPGRGNEPPPPPPKKSAKSTQLGLGIPEVAKLQNAAQPKVEPAFPRSEPFHLPPPVRPAPSAPPEPLLPVASASIAPMSALPEAALSSVESTASEPLDVAAMAQGTFDPEALAEPSPPSVQGLAPLAAQLEPGLGADDDAGTEAVPLPALLKQRVQLGSRAVRLPLLVAAAVASVASIVGLIAFLLGTVVGPPAEAARPETPAAPSQDAPQASPKSNALMDRVAGGDRAAMQEIETKPAAERGPEETLALALGQSVRRKEQLAELAASFEKQPKLLEDAATRKKLLEYADNRSTGLEALQVIAALPGSLSADLLYEVWTGTTTRNEITELAETLLYSKTVRLKASKPLAVALDLRKAERCEQFQTIIPRAREDGDRRSLHLLARLMRRFGCGPKKTGDCYKCLRDSDELRDALKAVKTRPAPALR